MEPSAQDNRFAIIARALALAVLGLATVAPLGCDTMGDDFRSIGRTLVPPKPGEAARWMFEDDADRRREGLVLISNSAFGGEEPYVRAYRDFVSEERDPVVRTFAIRALGRHGTVDDAPALAERLGDDNVYVRWAAAISLQRIHNPAVIPNMLATLANPLETPDVREAIAVGLGQYREDRVFQALVRALDDPELTVNYAARDALRLMTGQSFGDDRVDWLRWYEGAERRGTAFDGPGQYLYPTYRRKLGFFERLAFWSVPTFEYPATPIGLTPAGTRGTYDDSTGTDADARPNG